MKKSQYAVQNEQLQNAKKQESIFRGKKQESFEFQFSDTQDIDRVLRQPRSAAYMDTIGVIDLLSETDEEIIEKLKEDISEEVVEDFSDMSMEDLLSELKSSIGEEFCELKIEMKSVLHGIIAKCRIEGCDCHAINPNGEILEHFKERGPMPEELRKGRTMMLKYPDCKCVEVYTDCCRIIQKDGTVLKVKNSDM